jgi:hypothetical protein
VLGLGDRGHGAPLWIDGDGLPRLGDGDVGGLPADRGRVSGQGGGGAAEGVGLLPGVGAVRAGDGEPDGGVVEVLDVGPHVGAAVGVADGGGQCLAGLLGGGLGDPGAHGAAVDLLGAGGLGEGEPATAAGLGDEVHRPALHDAFDDPAAAALDLGLGDVGVGHEHLGGVVAAGAPAGGGEGDADAVPGAVGDLRGGGLADCRRHAGSLLGCRDGRGRRARAPVGAGVGGAGREGGVAGAGLRRAGLRREAVQPSGDL